MRSRGLCVVLAMLLGSSPSFAGSVEAEAIAREWAVRFRGAEVASKAKVEPSGSSRLLTLFGENFSVTVDRETGRLLSYDDRRQNLPAWIEYEANRDPERAIRIAREFAQSHQVPVGPVATTSTPEKTGGNQNHLFTTVTLGPRPFGKNDNGLMSTRIVVQNRTWKVASVDLPIPVTFRQPNVRVSELAAMKAFGQAVMATHGGDCEVWIWRSGYRLPGSGELADEDAIRKMPKRQAVYSYEARACYWVNGKLRCSAGAIDAETGTVIDGGAIAGWFPRPLQGGLRMEGAPKGVPRGVTVVVGVLLVGGVVAYLLFRK